MQFLNRFVVHITVVILLFCSSNIKWGGNYWKDTIVSDGKGYYVYLPAVFIYHDLNFSFFEEIEQKYYNENTRYDFRSYANDKAFSKYSMGTALLMLPFFLIAHILSFILGYATDGYSQLYNIMICISTIFYFAISLTYLKKTLSLYKVSDNAKTITILAFAFGTNLFYYAINEPALSHIYSFAAITMFIYYCKVYFKTGLYKYFLRLSIIIGIILFIKQINVLIVLAAPFIAGDFTVFKKTFLSTISNVKKLITIFFFIFLCWFAQLFFYYQQIGIWLFDSYPGEGFDFSNPYFLSVLFSYKKGLFVYTPLLLLSFVGIYYLFVKNKFEAITFFLFFFILTYVLSSWWCWYYGGSFGLRAYLEYYALFAIVFAVFVDNVKTKVYRSILLGLIALLVMVGQIQVYQYRYMHIHWSEMNKEKYWNVFLRVDKLLEK